MSAEQVARLIADFDRPEPPKTRSRVVPFDHLHHSSVQPQHQPLLQKAKQQPLFQPQPQMQPKPLPVQEDDGYERGRVEGYASALAEFEQRLEQEKQVLAVQAAEERQQLLNETAAKLAGDIAEMGDQLQGRIAGVAARLLEPLISNALQKQAVTAFIEHLSSITTDSRRPVLRITGPSDLLELIRSKLGVRAIASELRAGPETEASIVVDQIVLETQLKIWTERLKMAVQS
jgi:flagellar biosynthesis/type III secretory pathway protein FliH